MSNRYVGGVVTEKVNVAQSPWSGEWTEQAQLQAKAQGTWAPLNAQIGNSLRFRSSASAYLSRTPAAASNRMTWTWSGWVKLGAMNLSAEEVVFSTASTGGADPATVIQINSSYTLEFSSYTSSYDFRLVTTQVLRDPSAWYHIIIVYDSTNATASSRCKIYINGSQVTSFSTATYPSQNFQAQINTTFPHLLGARYSSPSTIIRYFDGYLAEVNFIDGQALTPAAFGIFDANTGVWKPTVYGGAYGTNGFHLPFSNGTSTTTLGYDTSGNSNNWTCNNISLTAGSTYDWMLDSPTPLVGTSYGVGNYAVLNPLNASSSAAVSDGNLKISSADAQTQSSLALPLTGKWYFEYTAVGVSGAGNGPQVGLTGSLVNSDFNYGVRYSKVGQKNVNGTWSAYGSSWSAGNVIGVAYDADASSVTFYLNNTSQGAISVTSGYVYYAFVFDNGSNGNVINFGQRPFSYSPPTGYKTLCTYNLPAPAIANGANYMAATTYTGLGVAQAINNTVNGVSFKPDFVWTKSRTNTNFNNLMDSVRGTNKDLYSNSTAAEDTNAQIYTALNSNGFSVGTDNSANQAANTFVGWQWKAGGTAVTNTNGSITSQVSASALSGFSVVTYTGTGVAGTIGHGLGVTPAFIITKSRSDATTQWVTWHKDLSGAFSATCGYLYLNSTNAASTTTIFYNGTQINSSTIGLQGTGTNINNTGSTYVAYCFAAIAGYSAFGSYTGNGSADGPFVYCGFRPRFVLIKNSSATANWLILDTARLGYNGGNNYLYPSLSNAEDSGTTEFDILSNGFKPRYGLSATFNSNGATYIYAAFAENPFQNALAR